MPKTHLPVILCPKRMVRSTDYEQMMTRSQIHIPIHRKSCNLYETLDFCGKNGLVIQNNELGTNSDKILADSPAKNALEYL